MMINNSLFRLSEIPDYHPISQYYERQQFWKGEKRKCIEGCWQSGKWMPGPLYYYINFHYIEIEDEISQTLGKGLPFLRDIDWELFLYYEECRGFSGFELDTTHTCDRRFGPEKELSLQLGRITPEELETRIYVPAREYLRRNHGKALGKPLYKNHAKNFISMQARGGGKSYATSGMVDHNFLFDGATDYDYYLQRIRQGDPLTSDTLVGAIDTKYSGPLIAKINYALDALPGATTVGVGKNQIYYPSPLYSKYEGSWQPNNKIRSLRSNSKIYHRTFQDNPTAGNAGRPNFVPLDEIGFFTNLIEALAAIEASQTSRKFRKLVIWMLGTGGYVSGAAVRHAEKVYRDPEAYNALAFDDIYEGRGKQGYFVPVTLTRNEFKEGPNLITNLEKANLADDIEREIKRKNPDPGVYRGYVINSPRVPSEIFLLSEGSFFPVMDLKEQLGKIESNPGKYLAPNFIGSLEYQEGVLTWVNNTELVPIRSFPLEKGADKRGCIELFEKPHSNREGIIPWGQYIMGADTVDKAAATTDSLFSCFVMDRTTRRIVAEFTGRRDDPNENYEIARRLSKFYNAPIMYEQSMVGLYAYMDNCRETFRLADTPPQLRNTETYRSGTNTSKGIAPSQRTNDAGRDFIKSWLLQPLSLSDPGYKNLHEIKSIALLLELIGWNPDGNFDRVSALIMLLWFDNTLYKEQEKKQEETKGYLDSAYWKKFGLIRK